ncbi:MAG TPA: rhodanese-like domain-containing protein [Nannocystis sp.]|jgi:rhodanese-related sulfurtransferase
MPIQRLSSREAIERVASDAALVHIDVRSEPEFTAGHAPGAYNVPLMHMGPAGMTPNPNFTAEVERAFPDKDTPIMVSCKAGGRSAKAAAALEALGYRQLADHIGGWGGGNGDPGWVAAGGPSATQTQPGRSYPELKA